MSRRKLDESEIGELLDCLSATDSEAGGDSDAEDSLTVPESAKASSSHSSPSGMNMEEEEDSNHVTDTIPDSHLSSESDLNSESEDSESENDTQVNSPRFRFSKRGADPSSFKNFVFSQPYGPKLPVNLESPLEIFSLFFTQCVLDLIVRESNKYAEQKGTTLDLTVMELKAFLGMLIIMGFHSVPSIRLFWSTNPNFHVSRISEIMSLKRFLKILRFAHLNDNQAMPQRNDPAYDKLYKIRPLVNILNNNFKNAFSPSRFLSIDESMVAFKGRSSLKQYMPLKPVKRGFKVFVISCAVSGYMLKFQVYEGKSDQGDGPLGQRTVMSLASMFEHLGYCLFFDRFFTSINLLSKLLNRGLYGCGTILPNRKFFPRDILVADKHLKLGESDFAMSGDISVSKWRDRGKKSVVIGSSMHNPIKLTFVTRRNKEGLKEIVPCPESVADYNRYMGGVDKFDQLQSTYNIAWKSRRGWMKVFYYMIECALVNSYIIYKVTSNLARQKNTTHLQFRSSLADELIGNFCSKGKPGPLPSPRVLVCKRKSKKTPNPVQIKDIGLHMPVPGKCNRCALCSTKAKPKRSSLSCSVCQVALCKTCFAPFHQK